MNHPAFRASRLFPGMAFGDPQQRAASNTIEFNFAQFFGPILDNLCIRADIRRSMGFLATLLKMFILARQLVLDAVSAGSITVENCWFGSRFAGQF